jgi:threonine dehydrogenase-like Zn-dependent dehydrogenase
MRQVAITDKRSAELIEKAKPVAEGNWAVVKIHVAPMCAEYKRFVKGGRTDCLGHEAAGEVVEVDSPGAVQVGDRVVVMPQYPCGECELCLSGDYIFCEHKYADKDTTMTQYVRKPAWLLPKIPDGVSYERASLACCGLGASFGAFQRLGVQAFDTVLITGLGPVGLGAVIHARYRNSRVIAVESNEYRANIARSMGVEEIVNPLDPDAAAMIKSLTDGVGPDCAVDCSGAVAAHRLCIDTVRCKGKIAFVGESMAETPVVISKDMLRKGLTLIGSWHYNLRDFPKLMQVIQHSPHIDRLVTHVFPMSRIQEAFETSASQQCGKILLKPWE